MTESDPPTVTDVEIDRQPPFVHLVERHETGREILLTALAALFTAVVMVAASSSPAAAAALALVSSVGGFLLGRWTLWPDAFGE